MTNTPLDDGNARAETSAGETRVHPRALVREAAGALRERARDAVAFRTKEVVGIAILVVLVLTGAAVAYVRARPAPAASMAPVQPSGSAAPTAPSGRLVVHVVGAVKKPGVYDFADGARVIDAVHAAGGFARGADRQTINLARKLVDGEQVVVLRRGTKESPPGSGGGGAPSAAGPDAKVNINTATSHDFEGLPGIGPVLAQRIVDYRTQHGPFRTVKDLLKVPGIGPRKFDSLEPHCTV